MGYRNCQARLRAFACGMFDRRARTRGTGSAIGHATGENNGTSSLPLVSGTLLAVLLSATASVHAQTCPAAPSRDVILFLDNSGSITNEEFDGAQQAIASVATSILSRPGYRLAVVNWSCTGVDSRDGCRIDLATAVGANGGWYTTASSFAYAGNNSASNRVCRSFGNNSVGDFLHRNNCGGPNFVTAIPNDNAQDAYKRLNTNLYLGGGTGGTDSSNAATVGLVAPVQPLMIIHMTDASNVWMMREPAASELPTLGYYYYTNYFKNVRDALIVGVGINDTTATLAPRRSLGAMSSKGGSSTEYDTTHSVQASTQAYDTGAPRLATYSSTFSAAQIVSAANTAINATIPACVILRKQSVGGHASFDFTGGTNGLPTSLTLTTSAATNPAGAAYNLTRFNTATGITETLSPNWAMTNVSCVNASNVAVAVTADPATGAIALPDSAIVSGARLTCTVTNTVQTDIRVVKTASADPVANGDVVGYTLAVTNNGPTDATNVLLTDSAGAGQNCTVPSTTATCSATGGASCPSPTVSVSSLLGAGITIPSLPVGGQVTVALQCLVTASGTP